MADASKIPAGRGNQLRVLAASIARVLHPGSALDIGCGQGLLPFFLRKQGIAAYGVDVSRESLISCPLEVLSFLCEADVQRNLPFPDGSMDLVTVLEVMEHLHYLHEAVEEIRRVLKPGGLVFMTSPHPFVDSKCGQLVIAKRWRRLDPTHVNVHNGRYWQRLFVGHGFRSLGVFRQPYRQQDPSYWPAAALRIAPWGDLAWAHLVCARLFQRDTGTGN